MISNLIRSSLLICGALGAVTLSSFSTAQAQQKSPGTSRMYAEVGLTNNYVDKGLTQSDKNLSINAGTGYWFGNQGRIGLNAASVKYANESATVELAGFGEFKFIFTPNADLRIRNDLYRYFSESTRDKVVVLLDQNFFDYHVLLLREDNFEGTKKPRNWFAFHKDWVFSPSIQFNTTAGYSMVDPFDNYFDTRVGLTYITGNITASLVNTYVSNASQFGDRADSAFLVVLAAKF